MFSFWRRGTTLPVVRVSHGPHYPGLAGAPLQEISAAILAHLGLGARWSEEHGVELFYRSGGAEPLSDTEDSP